MYVLIFSLFSFDCVPCSTIKLGVRFLHMSHFVCLFLVNVYLVLTKNFQFFLLCWDSPESLFRSFLANCHRNEQGFTACINNRVYFKIYKFSHKSKTHFINWCSKTQPFDIIWLTGSLALQGYSTWPWNQMTTISGWVSCSQFCNRTLFFLTEMVLCILSITSPQWCTWK